MPSGSDFNESKEPVNFLAQVLHIVATKKQQMIEQLVAAGEAHTVYDPVHHKHISWPVGIKMFSYPHADAFSRN
jgi:hypothetical protein